MKLALKILGGIAMIAFLALGYMRLAYGQSMPIGAEGAAADALAQRMMKAAGDQAWNQTRYVQWTFAGRNSYVWDRSLSLVEVTMDETKVMLDTKTRQGEAYRDIQLDGEEKEEALKNAWSNFCNDSFWLNAPLKVMDPGTSRELVIEEDKEALLVKYSTGGVSPGDAYLWYIGEDGLPYAYRMWVQIIPLPGLLVSWENWKTIHTGAKIATDHKLGPMNIEITNLKTGSRLEELGLQDKYFLR